MEAMRMTRSTPHPLQNALQFVGGFLGIVDRAGTEFFYNYVGTVNQFFTGAQLQQGIA
jgi:hypothetical protein